jgi:hypothetical protein
MTRRTCAQLALVVSFFSSVSAFQVAELPQLSQHARRSFLQRANSPSLYTNPSSSFTSWKDHTNPSSTTLFGVYQDFVAGADDSIRAKANAKYLASLQVRVDRINAMESQIEELSDDDLQTKTKDLRTRLADGEDINGPLLEEAFALVREASW